MDFHEEVKLENMYSNNQISDAQRKLVKLGFAAKGTVYILIGILAILPVIGMGHGGGNGGQKEAIQWLMDQSYGIILVALIALGLLFYAIWRLMRGLTNSPNYSGKRGTIKRVGVAISGLLYGAFAFYAGNLVFRSITGNGEGSSSGSQKYQVTQELLQSTWGNIILIFIGLILIGRSIYYIYIALTGKYKERVRNYGVDERGAAYLIKAGMLGFIARGIVFTVIGYFVIRAVLEHDAGSATKGTGEAMDFIQSTGGNIVLILIALGLICYGIFMFIQAKYRNVESVF